MARKATTFSAEIRRDPVAFTRALCVNAKGEPADPHPGQMKVMRGVGKRYTVIAAGRQFGKSVLLAWYICWYLSTHPNRKVLIVAPALDQAKIIFRQVAAQFNHDRPLSALLAGKIKNSPFPELELINGSLCMARGANSPQYIRGHSPHLVIIDEAAFVKDGTIRELEPLLTVTGKEEDSGFIMISTPFGEGEFKDFYDRGIDEDGALIRRHHFTSLDNPHADFPRLYATRDYYGADSLIWRTEYMAEFVDGELQVFPEADIKWAYQNYPTLDPENGRQIFPVRFQVDHRYVSGVDLANTSDYFVQTMLDVTNTNLVSLVKMNRLQHKGYSYYKDLIRQEWRDYNHPETLIDATTLAEGFVEDLRDISAQGYKFTGTTAKYDAVQALVKMLSEHRLAIPNDRDIINELRYFTYSYTPTKKLKMEAKRGHDDIVMSLSLAAMLAARPHNTGFFMPVDFSPKPQPKPAPKTAAPVRDPWAEAFNEGWDDEPQKEHTPWLLI